MEIRPALWQSGNVTPDPYLQILSADQTALNQNPIPSALFALTDGPHLAGQQALADAKALALIRPLASKLDRAADGYWLSDARQLKALRGQNRDWQLVGVAQDRHGAMTLGEAGADLILFGHLEPILVEGDKELAQWWAHLFEVPCGLILNTPPIDPEAFGGDGQLEFYACA